MRAEVHAGRHGVIPAAAAILAAASPLRAEERPTPVEPVLELFAAACLEERPDFEGSARAFERAGLAVSGADPFHRSADGALRAIAAPAGSLPGTPGGTCTVMAEGGAFAPLADLVDALLVRHLPVAATRQEGQALAVGEIEVDVSWVWTWNEDGSDANVVLVRDADRALGLSVVAAPSAAEPAE